MEETISTEETLFEGLRTRILAAENIPLDPVEQLRYLFQESCRLLGISEDGDFEEAIHHFEALLRYVTKTKEPKWQKRDILPSLATGKTPRILKGKPEAEKGLSPVYQRRKALFEAVSSLMEALNKELIRVAPASKPEKATVESWPNIEEGKINGTRKFIKGLHNDKTVSLTELIQSMHQGTAILSDIQSDVKSKKLARFLQAIGYHPSDLDKGSEELKKALSGAGREKTRALRMLQRKLTAFKITLADLES